MYTKPCFYNTSIIQRLHQMLLVVAGITFIFSASANTLNDISYSTLPGEKIQIKLSLSEPVSEPASFTIDNPARIALDFPATNINLSNRKQDIGIGVARSVSAVEAGGRTRVVINLSKLVGYQTRVEDNDVIITLNETSQAGFAGAPSSTPVKMGSGPGASVNVLNVDFTRGERGEGRIVLILADPNTPVDMKKRGKQVVVTLKNSSLSEEMERRLDVIDFATPVSTVDAFNQGSDVRLLITAISDFEHIAYQAEEKLTIDVKPLAKLTDEKAKKRKRFEYTGEKLSLNFQNIEVRAVLQLIADFTGLNMVTSDSVGGNLTLRLKNVPWDQALDIVLKTKGLGKRQSGNVMMIGPAEEIAAREKLELEAQKQIVELAPLVNESVQINYAKADEIAKLLKSKGSSMVSKRGNITVDQRTNKLLIQETSDKIDAMIALVEELDIPIKQVLIESRIVLASSTFSKELGVRFGANRNYVSADGHTKVMAGDLTATTQYLNGEDIEAPERWNVNLPAASSAAGSIGLAWGRIPGMLLELELSAAQAEGQTEVVSSPRVITANQHEAIIESGKDIPYQEASSSGATSVSFKKAVLSLKVTPQITPDDRVIMDLEVNKDEPDFGNVTAGVPPINTQSVKTQVLVDNGETIVLGGVYEMTKSNTVNRVPFFGDLPLIGVLFRSKIEIDNKNELLIFVTPKILKDRMSL